MALLIGVTVPERLNQRELAAEAKDLAIGRTFDRAIFEYQAIYERVPNDLEELRKLPDADGSIAAALSTLNPKAYPTAYKPSADYAAALPKRKPRTTVIKASLNTPTEDDLAEGLSFTNYELRLPGPDKVLGNEDDMIIRDGIIKKASEFTKPTVKTTASSKKK
jgi:hypothetical protein